ncbi:MAG: UvrD-helicase domain-containing protein [Prevotellaceae bacterium]|nr:UvrD-helicase domain-containing protein [Prevotellaceae bacterium]
MKQEEDNLLDSLNPSQRVAVEYCDGPSLIIAGAGSGKTRVLINKMAYLIKEKGYKEWSILALTFTNKAARELKERIEKVVEPRFIHHQWVGTYHGVFLQILHREYERIGFSSQFTIYDTADSLNLIRSIVKEMGLNDKVYKSSVVLKIISNAKSQLITAEQYVGNPANAQSDARQHRPAIGQIFLRYSNRCRQSDVMDFDDILLYTYLLFEQNPDVLEKWKERIKFVLVDEYQDTNFAQSEILWLLTGDKSPQKICVVGDDAQSIYSFRGANIDNILSFQERYNNVKLFKLEQNYRSTQNIVEAANSLIEKNRRQLQKRVFSENDRGEKLHVLDMRSDIEEAKVVVNTILRIRRMEGCEYSDFAILYRTNAQSRVFEDTMRKEGLPYRIYGGLSFYQRKEIKDIIAYFHLAVNPNDEEALRRVINYPARGIGLTTVARIAEAATAANVSLWSVINAPEQYGLDVNKSTLAKLVGFRDLIMPFVQQAQSAPANEIGTEIVKQSGIMAEICQDRSPESLSRKENVEELINGLHYFCDTRMEEGNNSILLSDYLSEVSLLSDVDTDKGIEEHKVTLMTIHSAKGLEFGTVFIVGMEEGLFPSQMVSGNPREMEEERRLCYVAITRAKTHCYLSHAQCRFRYGKMEFSSPSRFLDDIDPRYLDRKNSLFGNRRGMFDEVELPWKRTSPSPRISITSSSVATPAPRPIKSVETINAVKSTEVKGHAGGTLSVGQHILHNRFGHGEVIKMEGSGENEKATVRFDNVGTKQLLLKFAKYTIVD